MTKRKNEYYSPSRELSTDYMTKRKNLLNKCENNKKKSCKQLLWNVKRRRNLTLTLTKFCLILKNVKKNRFYSLKGKTLWRKKMLNFLTLKLLKITQCLQQVLTFSDLKTLSKLKILEVFLMRLIDFPFATSIILPKIQNK